jgi:hypothetical protein
MANINSKSAGAAPVGSPPPPALVGGSVPAVNAGNSSNPAGNSGSGGASASPAPIPGTGTTAKTGLRTEFTQVVSGIGSQIPDGSSIQVAGVLTTKQQLLNACTALLALYAAVDTAATALKNQRVALKAATPGGRVLLANIKAGVVAFFGKGNPALAAFGFSLAKPKPLTAEQKLARKVKAAATRLQRGTGGKRQKAEKTFTGTVDIQTTLSGTPTAGGNTPAASGSSAGVVSTPAPSGNSAPASGSTSSAS